MVCPQCRREYPAGALTCPECGVTLAATLPPAPAPTPDVGELVTVSEGFDPTLFLLAQSALQDAGILYVTEGEGIQDLFAGGRGGLGFNPVTGPPRIRVKREDAERARAALSEVPEPLPSDAELAALAESAGQPEEVGPVPSGLGGLLVALGVILHFRAVWIAHDLSDLVTGWNSKEWRDVVTPGGRAYHPLWAPYRVGFLAIDSLLFLWAMILIALFWRRNRWFSTATSLFLLADWVSEVLSLLVLWQIPSYAAVMSVYTLRDFFLLGILALVGTLYLRDSARVRATFTE